MYNEPSTSNFEWNEKYKNIQKSKKIITNKRIIRCPIVRPKIPTNKPERPLIAILDKMEYEPEKKRPYYSELDEILKEFNVSNNFDVKKPTTMSGIILAEKLELVQRLRGENKFLSESIKTKIADSTQKEKNINEIRQSTIESHNQCIFLRDSIRNLEYEIEELDKKQEIDE